MFSQWREDDEEAMHDTNLLPCMREQLNMYKTSKYFHNRNLIYFEPYALFSFSRYGPEQLISATSQTASTNSFKDGRFYEYFAMQATR